MQELRDGGSVAMLRSVNDLYELLTFNEVMQDISVKDTEILDNMKGSLNRSRYFSNNSVLINAELPTL